MIDQGLATLFEKDARVCRAFANSCDSPYRPDFTGSRHFLNVYSLVGLLVLSLLGFVLNYRRVSIGLIVALAGSVALALFHLRSIPFFAIVAAPIAALNLAEAGRRLAERPLQNQTMRMLHALRGGGRVVVGIACVLLISVSYAGWLHPTAQQRRWNWDVEPSESLKHAAEQIHTWRAEGTLPPEARLLNLQPDFASYVAWYAPGEKDYFDYRVRFHAPEARDYVALRRYLSHVTPQERQQDSFDFPEFLRRNRITYLVNSSRLPQHNRAALSALIESAPIPDWVLWYVTGRATILGWVKQDVMSPTAFARLRFDPVRTAFINVEPLPAPVIRPPLPVQNEWDRFVTAPPISPAEGEESHFDGYRDPGQSGWHAKPCSRNSSST